MAGNQEVTNRVERGVEQLDGVIRDLRNYIFGLRPGILADRQLEQALHSLGEEMQERSGEQVEVLVDAALAARLSPHSSDIVQLTREALSNVARHAGARRAKVRLERDGSGAALVIEDDGVGFEVDGDSAGSGLKNMRARAAGLGGAMRVESATGRGTTLRISFPV